MKKTYWLLVFLSLLIPSGLSAQTQDIHALAVVTQALGKAKEDNKTSQSAAVLTKVHQIENLTADGEFESVEKTVAFRIHTKDGKLVEELARISPPKTSPPNNPLDFDKLLDAFVSRFYFWINPEKETVNGRINLVIHFWPRDNLPPESEYSDYVLNRISGILYIEEKTNAITRMEASLSENVNEKNLFYSFHMDRFDLKIEFQDWNGLGLPKTIFIRTRYSYRKVFSTTRRYQDHMLSYEYSD